MVLLFIYWYICLRNPFDVMAVTVESDCHYVEKAFMPPVRISDMAPEEFLRSLHDVPLLLPSHTILWRSLNAFATGLDLHKMYSRNIEGDYIYLKMPALPVPFQNRVPYVSQKFTGQILSLSSY